jgi:hypothetical protein
VFRLHRNKTLRTGDGWENLFVLGTFCKRASFSEIVAKCEGIVVVVVVVVVVGGAGVRRGLPA